MVKRTIKGIACFETDQRSDLPADNVERKACRRSLASWPQNRAYSALPANSWRVCKEKELKHSRFRRFVGGNASVTFGRTQRLTLPIPEIFALMHCGDEALGGV